jgi:ABC-type bacteriocin/lantibiotic exporter with double-glycine peptidase domain
MLLALHGVPVDHRMIEKYIPSQREGMSLDELQEASTALGLRTEVRHCSIDELCRRFQSPVVAYLVDDIRHHYVVILGMTHDTVTILDGTTGERYTVTNKWLEKSWSGYVLMPEAGPSVLWLLLAISLFSWLLPGVFALRGFPGAMIGRFFICWTRLFARGTAGEIAR